MRHIRIEPVCIRDGNIVECCTSIAGEFDRIIGVGKSIETELQTAVMVGECSWPTATPLQVAHKKRKMFRNLVAAFGWPFDNN